LPVFGKGTTVNRALEKPANNGSEGAVGLSPFFTLDAASHRLDCHLSRLAHPGPMERASVSLDLSDLGERDRMEPRTLPVWY